MKQAPTTLIEFLGGAAAVRAIGLHEVAIIVDKDDPIIVNRIPVELRVYFKRNTGGNWYSTNFFCYRLDNAEVYHPQHPATEGQKSKIYRAAVEVCEALDESFLREGELGKMDREIETINIRITEL